MKSILIVTFFSFLCFFCFNKFEIIDATSQNWTGGIPQAGYGTKYELTIIPKTNSDKLEFDRIWVGGKYFNVYAFQKGKKMRNNSFGKGDTITIMINDRTIPELKNRPIKERCLVETHSLPHKYEGEALLSYTYNGKRKYTEIKGFKVKRELFYP